MEHPAALSNRSYGRILAVRMASFTASRERICNGVPRKCRFWKGRRGTPWIAPAAKLVYGKGALVINWFLGSNGKAHQIGTKVLKNGVGIRNRWIDQLGQLIGGNPGTAGKQVVDRICR